MNDQFRQAVLRTVRRIARGRVATYGDVAAAAGYPGRARHVGKALQALPEETRVPWHRVINSQGGISARGDGSGEAEQRLLLEREGVPFTPAGRVDLRRCRQVFLPAAG